MVLDKQEAQAKDESLDQRRQVVDGMERVQKSV
jgi:hypothetical protein